MHIQIETTPNPEALKFLPGRVVNPGPAADYTTPAQATGNTLVERLLALSDVARVHVGFDFVSVSRRGNADWAALRPRVLDAIATCLAADTHPAPVTALADVSCAPADQGIVGRIQTVIATQIRPAIARDGGGITLVRFADGVAHLRLEGACAGCPDATRTLGEGVARLLRNAVAEVCAVRQVVD